MKILFDTNVVLDVLLQRKPFDKEATLLFAYNETNRIDGWLGATTVTTIYYLLAKSLSTDNARTHLKSLLKLFQISAVNRLVLEEALQSNFSDYEDAVLFQSALHAGLDGIVSRNPKDFNQSSLALYTPKELVSALQNKSQ